MVILSLTLSNMKRFRNQTLQFGPGLTIVKGPNEAGKSTVQSALLLALFGDSHSRSSAMDKSRTWGQDSFPQIKMEFESGGQAFVLERDFEAKIDRLRNVSSGEEISDRNNIASRLAEITGLGNEELFKSTACVTQNNIAAISPKGKQQISEQLQSVITGGGEDTAAGQSVALLVAQAADLRRGLDRPASNPGAIKDSQDTVSRLEQDLAARQSEAARAKDAAEAIAKASADIDARSARLEAVRSLLLNQEKSARLREERDAGANAEDALQREIESIESLRGEIRQNKKTIDGFHKFSEMPPDTPQALATLEATLRVHVSAEKTAEEDFQRASVANAATNTPSLYLSAFGTAIALIVAIVCVATARYIGFTVGIGLAVGLFLLYQNKRSAGKDTMRRVEEAEERLDRIRSQTQSSYEEQQSLVKLAACASAEELKAKWSEWSQLKQETARLEAEFAGKLAGKTLEQMQSERRKRSKARRDAEEQLESSDMAGPELSPLERQQLALEAGRLNQEIAELDQSRTTSRAIIDTIDSDLSVIYEIEESLASSRDRLARMDRLARVYTIAAEGIREAVGQTLQGARPILEQETAKYLSMVTDCRYNKIEVDERNLDFRIYSSEKSGSVEADGAELSRGTLDQFYLAARIAMLDLVAGEAKPLVLLDDPLVTFDNHRADNAMNLLKQISRDRQVLLFTCSDRYTPFADQSIELRRD